MKFLLTRAAIHLLEQIQCAGILGGQTRALYQVKAVFKLQEQAHCRWYLLQKKVTTQIGALKNL